jgi:hypothetical protein
MFPSSTSPEDRGFNQKRQHKRTRFVPVTLVILEASMVVQYVASQGLLNDLMVKRSLLLEHVTNDC